MITIFGPMALAGLPNEVATASIRQATAMATKRALTAVGFFFALGGSPTSANAVAAALTSDSTSAKPRMMAPTLEEAQGGTEASGGKIAEARRLSGLTWEQLADAMGVTRRTLHLWANGRPIGAANEERLARLLGALRVVDRGTARANRLAIMSPLDRDGRLPFDLLSQEKFSDFVSVLGRGRTRPDGPSLALSSSAREARMPPRPIELLAALQDEITTAPRPRVPGKAVRRPASRV